MTQLRSYQQDILTEVERHRRPIVVAPTGSGKTVMASGIIQQAENRHVLFLAHRRELIHQAKHKLADFGISAGLILAGEPLDRMRRVQIASVQTLWSRCMRGSTDLPHADIVLVDEAHHVRARTYQKILEQYPHAKIIGMTATPCRRDGRGLGNVFDCLVECPQVQALIDLGYLVKTKVFAPYRPDLKGVSVRKGDYVERELAERMDRAELVGDIVSHWHRHAERRKTVVFASGVGHSRHLMEEFVKSGVRAEHIDGSTPKEERDEILRRLSVGDLELVTNCMVLTEGWDMPDVACCVLARPTKSEGLYRQMVGRVIRPADGKDHALILDHAGAVFQHGFIEEPVNWTLDEDKKAVNPAQEARALNPSNRLVECSQCQAIRTAGKPCGHCGFMPRRPAQYLHVHDGELALLDQNGRLKPEHHSPEQRQGFYQQLLHISRTHNYKHGWAAHKFKEKFGSYPPWAWNDLTPHSPSPEVAAWVRHLNIRYAKSRAAA